MRNNSNGAQCFGYHTANVNKLFKLFFFSINALWHLVSFRVFQGSAQSPAFSQRIWRDFGYELVYGIHILRWHSTQHKLSSQRTGFQISLNENRQFSTRFPISTHKTWHLFTFFLEKNDHIRGEIAFLPIRRKAVSQSRTFSKVHFQHKNIPLQNTRCCPKSYTNTHQTL